MVNQQPKEVSGKLYRTGWPMPKYVSRKLMVFRRIESVFNINEIWGYGIVG